MTKTHFTVQRRIEFHDTDMAGIVHFSNFFRFMEFAEVAFMRSKGLNVQMEWEGQQIGFPRVSASCDFKSPAKFEEILDIAVIPVSIGKKSVSYVFHFSKEGIPVAEGKMTAVCCRINKDHKLESIEIPASLRTILTENNNP